MVPTLPLKWTIYDRHGRELFDIFNNDNDNDDNISKIINAIYNKNDEINPKDIKRKIQYILAQMEVNLLPKDLEKMICIMCEKIKRAQIVSKRKCLELIIENHSKISQCPPKSLIRQYCDDNTLDGFYSKKWLIETMAKVLNVNHDDRSWFLTKHDKMFLDMINIINDNTSLSTMYSKSLLEILNTSVSMRSSYGIRKKGINQIIRHNKIYQNVDTVNNMTDNDIDDLFEKNCTEDGVIILAINKEKIISMIEEKKKFNFKSLTTRYSQFDRSSKELASSYMPNSNQFNFEYRGESSKCREI